MPDNCSKCRRPNPTPDKSRCPACAAYGNKITKKFRHGQRGNGLCYDCPQPVAPGRTRCQTCLDKSKVRNKVMCDRIKLEALNAYGGPFCACCEETIMDMLTLDHIAQDGAADRRENGCSGTGFYYRLKKAGWPTGFRVLCRNCNYAVFLDPQHICPHRTGCFSGSSIRESKRN